MTEKEFDNRIEKLFSDDSIFSPLTHAEITIGVANIIKDMIIMHEENN